MEANGLNMEVNTGTIRAMPDIEDYLTTAEAVELAEKIGKKFTRQYITMSARGGKIEGCVKMGASRTGIWLIPRPAFIEWLGEDRRPGPKSED